MSSKSGEKTTYLSTRQLEELAADKKNLVYAYEHDKATRPYTSAEQARHIQDIRVAYVNEQLAHPQDSDDALCDRICDSKPEWKEFRTNHGKIVKTLCSRTTTPEQINIYRYMLYLRNLVETGKLSQQESDYYMQKHLVECFKTNMTLEQYKASLKTNKQK